MISQNQTINKILSTKDFSIVTLNNLDDKYFFNYKNEFNFIKNHYDMYKQVPDIVTFLGTFPDFGIVEVSEPNNYLLEQLYNDYNQAYLATSFNTIKPMLENGDTGAAVKYFMGAIDGLQRGNALSCTDLITDTSRYDHYKEKQTDKVNYYIPTGFHELDETLGGLDRENENMVISARPGQGKTQVMVKMAAEAFLRGETVGVFEGEMTADKLGYRFDTILGNINNTAMNRGRIDIDGQYSHYIQNISNLSNGGSIKIMTLNDCGGSCTVDTLRAFIEKEHLTTLFVDQYSLMEDVHKAKSEFERVGNIAKDIKKLQVEKKIPIVSVSQMNRTKNEDGSQDTTQISLSDKIPQYATTLIMLEQKEAEDGGPVRVTLNIVKARDGGDHNKFTYAVDFNNGRWEYVQIAKTDEEAAKLKESYDIPVKSEECPF